MGVGAYKMCKWKGEWIFSGRTQTYSTVLMMCDFLLAEEQMKLPLQRFFKIMAQ